MKNRSILLALAASTFAATLFASLMMPPMTGAHVPVRDDTRSNCQGYQRLAILLQSTATADSFSMEECSRSLGKSSLKPAAPFL